VDDDVLADHARWELSEAASRAAMCRDCPPRGGLCDGQTGYFAEGLYPMWLNDHIEPMPCDKFARYEIDRTLRRAGVGCAMIDATFESYHPNGDDQEAALAAAQSYVRHVVAKRDGASLTLLGQTGRGKTHLAVAACRELSKKGVGIMFVYVPMFLDAVRREGARNETLTFDRAINVPLLVLDDIGAERSTDYAREVLETIVHARTDDRRSMVVTGNRSLDDMEKSLGQPLVRQLVHASSFYAELA